MPSTCDHCVANADLDQKKMDTLYVSQNLITQMSCLFFLKLTPEHCFEQIDSINMIGSNSPRQYKMRTCKADLPKQSVHVFSLGTKCAVKKHNFKRPKTGGISLLWDRQQECHRAKQSKKICAKCNSCMISRMLERKQY